MIGTIIRMTTQIIYFWNFPFNIFSSLLTAGNLNWKAKPQIRGYSCTHKDDKGTPDSMDEARSISFAHLSWTWAIKFLFIGRNC